MRQISEKMTREADLAFGFDIDPEDIADIIDDTLSRLDKKYVKLLDFEYIEDSVMAGNARDYVAFGETSDGREIEVLLTVLYNKGKLKAPTKFAEII